MSTKVDTQTITLEEVVTKVLNAHKAEKAVLDAYTASLSPVADACEAMYLASKQGMSIRQIEEHPMNLDNEGKAIVKKDTINRYLAIGQMTARVGASKLDEAGISLGAIKANLDNGAKITDLHKVNNVSEAKQFASPSHPAVRAKAQRRKANNLPKDSKADKIVKAIEAGKWTKLDLDKIRLAVEKAYTDIK